jgi:broad specificity phosphatase PhoE
MRAFRIGALSVVLFATAAPAPPREVLLIRHAEKEPNSIHLSADGWKRAEALPKLFEGKFPKPDFIFATKPSKTSNRPVETVTPLSKTLSLPVNAVFANADFQMLAADLLTNPRFAGKVVLVCWHHGTIPELARKLGAEDVPEHWKEQVFDAIWVLTYEDGKVKFKKRHQALMPADAKD